MSPHQGIHHISLKTQGEAQFQQVLAFYRDVLGCPLVRTWGAGGNSGAMLDLGNTLLEVTANGAPGLKKGLFGHIAFAAADVDALAERLRARGALAVPAHINRGANGILNALGFLPPGLPFDAVEVAPELPLPEKGIPPLKRLHSSDAHYLENIFERTEFLDMSECSPRGFFDYIRSG